MRAYRTSYIYSKYTFLIIVIAIGLECDTCQEILPLSLLVQKETTGKSETECEVILIRAKHCLVDSSVHARWFTQEA